LAFVRQQAWLSTPPDKPKKGEKPEPPDLTHYQILESKYNETEWFERLTDPPDMPMESALWRLSFIGDGADDGETTLPYELAHIWNHFLEIGPVSHGGMGPVPLSFLEIHAWMQSTKTNLSPWEAVLIRKCSQEWIEAQYQARKPGAIPPWTVHNTDDRRREVAKRLKAALGGRVNAKKVKKK
jgi:hypothetical protein